MVFFVQNDKKNKNCAIFFLSASKANFLLLLIALIDSKFMISLKKCSSEAKEVYKNVCNIKNSIDDDLGQLIDSNSLMRVG